MRKLQLVLILPFLYLLASCTRKQDIDMLISAKKIYLLDSLGSTATTIAINNGKILETGDYTILSSRYNAKEKIILSDAFIYPGFIDAHCHFSGYALDRYKVDLVGTTSFDDVLNRVNNYEKENKLTWIYGRGWDQNDWEIKEYPDKTMLDKLFPDKPVILKRIDGHAILVNQKALDMAGITTSTKIQGGIIELKNGKLTGILIDNAAEPVEAIVPELPVAMAKDYLQKMEIECFKNGLTGVVDCGVKKDKIELIRDMYREKMLSINNSILLSQDEATLEHFVKKGPVKENNFQVCGIKVYADGALGSRGACLLQDYTDMPGHRGMILTPVSRVTKICSDAIKYDWQVCTHAIGDSANREILKLYAQFLGGANDKRWRIEHAQVVNPADYSMFANYSVIPSVQPTHAISDMPWAETRLGSDRIKHAYAYKSLLDQNGWIALGTDFPVEAINPLATFYTAVARKDKEGKPTNGFLSENALSREEALKGMTIWAAKSVRLENEKGSLEPGKDADLVILNKDLINILEEEIPETKILVTISKGTIKYRQ